MTDGSFYPGQQEFAELAADYPATDFSITTQAQLDAFDIVVSNCNRRYAIQLNTTNPKVSFTEAGSASAGRHPGQCVAPTLTATQVTWAGIGATDRNGYYVIITVAP